MKFYEEDHNEAEYCDEGRGVETEICPFCNEAPEECRCFDNDVEDW